MNSLIIKDHDKKFKSKHGVEVIWYVYGVHIGFNCESLCMPVTYNTLPLCTEYACFVNYENGYYISRLVPRWAGNLYQDGREKSTGWFLHITQA